MPHPPPSEPGRPGKSLWAEEALSKQRNAEWNLGDGGGEEGGGGAAEAARLPASLSVRPGELPHPHPSQDCGAGEEGGGCARRLFSSSLLQTRVGKGCARSAAPRGCSAPSPDSRVRSVPAACLARSRPKCPKRRRALGTCPAAVRRAPRGLPALAHPQPGGRGSWPTPRRGAGNLNRLWSPPQPRRRDPAPGPGAPVRGGGCTRAMDLANTPL